LTAADVNRDGKIDLVVADAGSSTVTVLRGRGDGRFESDQRFLVGANPQKAVIEDFNKDGKADLAVGNMTETAFPSCLATAPAGFPPSPRRWRLRENPAPWPWAI
jgi:hypothetical protein